MLPAVSGSASFTPGPWHCESSLGLVRSAADHIVCAMPHALNKRAIKMRKPGDDAEITADARLIAAAPELLECLIHLADSDWFRSGMTGKVICGLDAEKVRNALSKLLGENTKVSQEAGEKNL